MENKKEQIICLCCGDEFTGYKKHNRKFCSKTCSNRWNAKQPEYIEKLRKSHLGQIPANKNKFMVENPKQRRVQYYRRLIFEVSEKQLCNRCSKEAKLVHHKNGNIHDNRIDNLEPLCYSCHSIGHDTGNNLPNDGGWSKRKLKTTIRRGD